ncbi:MAG: hypothetical protein ACJA0G_002440 [Kangiellaceae bacterium]
MRKGANTTKLKFLTHKKPPCFYQQEFTMSTFKDALNTLKEAAADFSTLTVTTYTGDLKVLLEAGQKVDSDGNATPGFSVNNLDFQQILDKTLNGTIDGALSVACFNTHYLDGDGVVFRSSDVPEEQMKKLELAHSAALTAGKETREGVLNLVKSTVEGVFSGR